MFAVSKPVPMENKILAALPHGELSRLRPHLENVRLTKGEIVYLAGDEIEYAYFLDSGLLSLLSTTETGSTIEVAMLGNEGMVGLPVILRNRMISYEVAVQFTTAAYRIKAEALQQAFDEGEALHELILRYLNVLIAQISQSTICNRFHSLEENLSRWLLQVQDRVRSDNLYFTQEDISHALGVPRTGVTAAAGTLQRAGLIRYSRGKIAILDRAKLEAHSCECYRNIQDVLRNFLQD